MSIANLPASETTAASSASAAGKSYRLGRIFAHDGRTVILPVDHGTMLGRVAGLEDPVALIRASCRFAATDSCSARALRPEPRRCSRAARRRRGC